MLNRVLDETINDGIAQQAFTRRAEFWAGVRATIPLVIGAIPFGIIFGALAVNSGISASGASTMSALVFAGSAQFIATGLMSSGTAPIVIVFTTLVVNLRHALYAASLAPHLKYLPQGWLVLLGFWLTDESYAVVIDRYNRALRAPAPGRGSSPHRHWFFFGSALFMYANWQLWTLVGIHIGGLVPDPRSWGLDFALSVTFIGLLIPMLRDKGMVAAVLVAGASAVLFHNLPNQFGLILAAIFSVAAGVLTGRLGDQRHAASLN